MFEKQTSPRSFLVLTVLTTAALLAACTPQAPARSRRSSGEGGSTGSGGAAGNAQAGGGGSAGDSGGSAGSGGSTGAGSPGSGNGSAGGSGMAGGGGAMGSAGAPGGSAGDVDAGAGNPADAGSDAGVSAIPGYALCLVCHGPDGAGTDKGPDIQHPVKDYSSYVVRNGRAMTAYKEPMPKFTPEMLSDELLEGIYTFLASAPKPTAGAALYKDYCQNCHGADARGGPTMRNISNQPVAAFLDDPRKGHHPGEFSNRREYMPKWTAEELTDAELRLIFEYVDGL